MVCNKTPLIMFHIQFSFFDKQEYAAIFAGAGTNPGEKTLEDKFFEKEVCQWTPCTCVCVVHFIIMAYLCGFSIYYVCNTTSPVRVLLHPHNIYIFLFVYGYIFRLQVDLYSLQLFAQPLNRIRTHIVHDNGTMDVVAIQCIPITPVYM